MNFLSGEFGVTKDDDFANARLRGFLTAKVELDVAGILTMKQLQQVLEMRMFHIIKCSDPAS